MPSSEFRLHCQPIAFAQGIKLINYLLSSVSH